MKGPTICRCADGSARRTSNPPRSRARGTMTAAMASTASPIGIDGEVNRRGGDALEAARVALPVVDGHKRCLTGDAKITVAGDLPCSKVIHAVGPAFGYSPHLADHADKLELLEAAYKNSMERARENELKSVGFCILSAGIFRGGCPLKIVI